LPPERWRGEKKKKKQKDLSLFHRRQTKAYREQVAYPASHGYWEKSPEWNLNSQVFWSITIFHLPLSPCHLPNALLTAVLNSNLLIKAMGRELVLAWAPPPTPGLTSDVGVNLSTLKSSAKGALNGNSSIFIVR